MLKIAVSQVVDARVQDVYAVIVDYQVMNQAILPQPYFEEVVLEEDGQEVAIGVGLTVEVFGHQIHFRQTEGEREDRLAVVEKDMMSDQSITITLDPLDSGRKTRVTITSEMPVSGGLQGLVQRLTQRSIVRHNYRKGLNRLADYLNDQQDAAQAMM